jgi:hypothetical protein
MIMSAQEDFLPWCKLQEKLALLLSAVSMDDHSGVRKLLSELVVGYTPEGEIVDWTYLQKTSDHLPQSKVRAL